MPNKTKLIKSLDHQTIIDLTARLIAIPSRNPPGQEKACAEFIYSTLKGWGIECELVLEPDPERPQVVAWLRGSGDGPTLILNGHMDTVTEGDPSAWTYSPFSAKRVGDRLYGLGATDMKGSLAIAMVILKTLQDSGGKFPGTLMFQAVMGEEMAEDGTRTLLKLGYKGDYAIVMEPTSLNIGRAVRGVIWHRVSLAGDPIHCGRASPETPDPITQFSQIGLALAEYHRAISKQTHPLLPNPACRITQVWAGERHNHIPGKTEFIIDRRMLPHETFVGVAGELRGILEKLKLEDPAIDYQMRYERGNEPVEIPPDSPIIQVLSRNSNEIRGVNPGLIGSAGGTDMRNFVFDQGIPAVNFGPGHFVECNCHHPDEYVPVEDLSWCSKIVMGAVYDVLSNRL